MTITPVYLKRNRSGLTLGTLSLNGVTTDAAGRSFQIEAQDADATWGMPQPVDVAVQRWMTDGAVASTQGHDNRELYFKVVVSASSSLALAAGEAALAKLAGQPTTLTWIPPEGSPAAPATVFEVWTWHLEPEFDGSREVRLARMYGVRMTAKPWARSTAITTAAAPAVPGSPTSVQIDACTVTTNWTGTPNAPTISGGTAIRETVAFTSVGQVATAVLTRTLAVTGMGTTPYLQLDMTQTGGLVVALGVTIDGVALSKVAQLGTVSYWPVPAGVTGFTTLQVTAGIQATHLPGNAILQIADVTRTDTIGAVGSRKMLARSLVVGGSVPTSGSIQVASPTATVLGNVLVYTSPDDGSGYTPPMRQYRTSGNTVTADATCVSGNREAFVNAGVTAGTITYTIPAGLLPEGEYVIAARFLFGVAATITTTVFTGSAGSTVTGKVTAGGAGAAWGIIGSLTLPGTMVPVESALSTIVFASGTATTGTHTIDELFLINVTRGAFSLVTGINSNTRLWLDAPDADPIRNRPAVYIGSQTDRSDAGTPLPQFIISAGDHDLDPDGAQLFTVTDGVDNAVVTGSFYHRWHTHAGD